MCAHVIGEAYTRKCSRAWQLTERETEFCHLLGQGKNNSEIAKELGIAEKTAKGHLARIYSKLGVTNRNEAMIAAQQLGLVKQEGALSFEAQVIVQQIALNPRAIGELAEAGLLGMENSSQ